MKKPVKYLLIFVLSIFLLGFGIRTWIEFRFETLINRNPERAYDLNYSNFELHNLFKGATLEDLEITPINVVKGHTVIRGTVEYAELRGMVWIDLFIGRKLNVEEIEFVKPVFEITHSTDTVKKTSGKGLQKLFGDILSRGKLKRFVLKEGSVVVFDPNSENLIGRLDNLNVQAKEMKTDSVQWKHFIPFELGSLQASIDSLFFDLNEYTELKSGRIEYKMREERLVMEDLSLKFTKDWKEVSEIVGKQVDLMEVELGQLSIDQIQTGSSLYSDLDIIARKITLEDVLFKDQRDKNMERPPDKVKPMFKGMVDAIPFELRVDSIELRNVEVWYSELPPGKKEEGTVRFENLNGSITGLTTLGEEQVERGHFKADLRGKLNGVAPLSLTLRVPYDREGFEALANIGPFGLQDLNTTLEHMAGVQITSGQSERIFIEMQAEETRSQNHMIFDYTDLKMHLVKEGKNHEIKNRGFMSAIANSAVRNHNMPSHGKYIKANYITDRNVYRGPFNLMWTSVMDGMMQIVPGSFVQWASGIDKQETKTGKKSKGKKSVDKKHKKKKKD